MFCFLTVLMAISVVVAAADMDTAEIIIELNDSVQPSISEINAAKFANSAERTKELVAKLRKFTQDSQRPILEFLKKSKVEGVESYWKSNRIFIPKANDKITEKVLGLFGEKITIRLAKVALITQSKANPRVARATKNEWNIEKINAPQAWNEGFEGEGIVVSHIDTGVRITHESLKGALRSDLSWFDPLTLLKTPSDDNGHGTHTIGIAAGRNGIGVARKDTFISCKGCDAKGSCPEQGLLSCAQWITCPSKPDGSGEDCSKKPALSLNAWRVGSEESWFNDVIDVWKAANIFSVFPIGNSGPVCYSVISPGDSANAFSVGATTHLDKLASFSSRGPTLRTIRIKPEVTAPGNQIKSAGNQADYSYSTKSGTSTAAAHVAGAVAIMLSKNVELSVDEITSALKKSTVQSNLFTESLDFCTANKNKDDSVIPWPNNDYGYGLIDIPLILQHSKQ